MVSHTVRARCVLSQYPGTSPLQDQVPLELTQLVAVSIVGNCLSFDRTDIAGKTLIVRNANSCRGRRDTLLRLLSDAQPGMLHAIVGFDDPNGDSLPPNFAVLPVANTPSYLRSRSTAGSSFMLPDIDRVSLGELGPFSGVGLWGFDHPSHVYFQKHGP